MNKHIALHGWQADFMPSCGGLLYRLRHELTGEYDLMRTPPDPESLTASPMLWGFPVLFPPNRIAGGTFTFNGKDYIFPLNDAARGCHIHGILLRTCWKYALNDSSVILHYDHPAEKSWDHDFSAELQYDFLSGKLIQTMTIQNLSPDPMPFLFGYHAAFHAEPDTRIRLTAGKKYWQLDDHSKCPTGKSALAPDWELPHKIGQLGPVSMLIPMEEHAGFRGVELVSFPRKYILRYSVDPQFRYWMLWNADNQQDFFCAEPQTCLINAPNLDLPSEISGMDFLTAGKKRIFKCELDISSI